jgi:hypothetical protein
MKGRILRRTLAPLLIEWVENARPSLLKWLELHGGSLDDYSFPSRTAPAPFARQHKISYAIALCAKHPNLGVDGQPIPRPV